MLRSLFNEEKTKRIRSIPFGSLSQADTMVWRGDKTGEYTRKVAIDSVLQKNQTCWETKLQQTQNKGGIITQNYGI